MFGMFDYSPVYILLFLASLSQGLEQARYRGQGLVPRSVILICGPNPTDCGGGWCCPHYDTCVNMPDRIIGCVAAGATDSSGNTITILAENAQSLNVMFSSYASEDASRGYFTTFDTYAEFSTSGAASSTSQAPAPGPTLSTTVPPSTTVSLTVVPTETKSSASETVVPVLLWQVSLVFGWLYMLAGY